MDDYYGDKQRITVTTKAGNYFHILIDRTNEDADVPGLPVGERNILLLVCCKLLCAAAEPFVCETVTVTFDCGGHTFTAKGKQVLSRDWRAIQEVFRSSLRRNRRMKIPRASFRP